VATTDRFRWSRKELTHGSCQKDDTFAQNRCPEEGQRAAEHRGQEHKACDIEAMVAARDEGERRARPQARRVQADQPEKDRGLVETFRRAQRASQGRCYRSALSMLTFYINRAGKTLPKTKRDRLEKAKLELKRAFGRE